MSASSAVQSPQSIACAEILPQREEKLAQLEAKRDAIRELASAIEIKEAAQSVENLLPGLTRQIEAGKKVVAALRAGYDLMTPAVGGTWVAGFIVDKDPRPWIVRRAGWSAIVLAGFLVAGGATAWLAMDPEGFTITDIVLSLSSWVLGSLFVMGFRVHVLSGITSAALGREGLPAIGDVLFLTKDRIPPPALLTLQKARESGLFDRIQVLAPRELFSRARGADPIIFGEIAGEFFLIAHFNLGGDLEPLGSAVSP